MSAPIKRQNSQIFIMITSQNDDKFLISSSDSYSKYYQMSASYFCNVDDNLKNSSVDSKIDEIKIDVVSKNIKEESLHDAHVEIVSEVTINNKFQSYHIHLGRVSKISKSSQDKISIFSKSILGYLSKPICRFFSRTCRAEFGDSKCGIDKSNYSARGQISNIISASKFDGSHSTSLSDIDFTNGDIVFYNTNNSILLSTKLLRVDGELVSFLNFDPENFFIKVGMLYEITIGCSKKVEDCSKKFNNIVNFRGEPFIDNQ